MKKDKDQIKALYVPRGFSHESLKRRVSSWWNRTFSYTGQEGYFEAGLDSEFSVSRIQHAQAKDVLDQKDSDIDVLIVNYKCEFDQEKGRDETVRQIAQNTSIPTVLFVGTDRARDLPPDDVLDHFDLVFKRECFKDKDRYSILNHNKDKIRPTMLACPIFTSLPWLPFRIKERLYHKDEDQAYEYDVFFSGQSAVKNKIRLNSWSAIMKHCGEYRLHGGLQPHPGYPEETPNEMRFEPLSRSLYAQTVRRSKINLALDGIGEFTFRHLEIWYFGGFLLSGPSIRDIDIPLPIKEGVHYIAFDDESDLIEKIHYYIENDTERERIAKQGKEMFDKFYDPSVHGKDISEAIKPYLMYE